MFCSSSVYRSKGGSKDYLPGQYHYNALVEREYEICSPLVSFDLRCESVTLPLIRLLYCFQQCNHLGYRLMLQNHFTIQILEIILLHRQLKWLHRL